MTHWSRQPGSIKLVLQAVSQIMSFKIQRTDKWPKGPTKGIDKNEQYF
jgi:hypothetical protein